jgi:hypothetical protein
MSKKAVVFPPLLMGEGWGEGWGEGDEGDALASIPSSLEGEGRKAVLLRL